MDCGTGDREAGQEKGSGGVGAGCQQSSQFGGAALFAVAMLATESAALRSQLEAFRQRQREAAMAMTAQLT